MKIQFRLPVVENVVFVVRRSTHVCLLIFYFVKLFLFVRFLHSKPVNIQQTLFSAILPEPDKNAFPSPDREKIKIVFGATRRYGAWQWCFIDK